MKRHEKASRILDTLEELYPNPGIPLDHKDPYTLLIAVLLSAQSTDKKVNEITPGLFSLADTPAAMAAVDLAPSARRYAKSACEHESQGGRTPQRVRRRASPRNRAFVL